MAYSTLTFREMTATRQEEFDKVFAQLTEDGMLLLADADLPSVGGLIANEKLRGSWWSHKLAHTIFRVSEMLDDHPDVLSMKLISGKVTFVHRQLWDRIYSIGVAREDWQIKNLSNNARRLLEALDHEGIIQTKKIGRMFGTKPGDTARELESRLLIHSEQIHTESGAHAKVLETWPAWAKRVGFRARAKGPVAARRFFDQRLAEINNKHGASGTLPWPSTV